MEMPIRASDNEVEGRNTIQSFLNNNDVPESEHLSNLGLYIDPRLMSRLLFLDFVYKKILPIQGIVMDLGTRWGQNAVVFQTLKAIYEPYNYQRRIVAFDTFSGFTGVDARDGQLFNNAEGTYSVTPGYEIQLDQLLSAHQRLHPLNHIKGYDIVKGDVSTTVPDYINAHPETIVSLAYFDMDLYKPTVDCINAIKDRLTIGSILVFDELNYSAFPGETLAVIDALGLRNVSVQRFPHCSRVSYIEIK